MTKNMEYFTTGLEFRMSLETKKIRRCGKWTRTVAPSRLQTHHPQSIRCENTNSVLFHIT